ncbi:hypothetical protein CRD18_10660 (plasmid) [Corynebacterium sp. LK31]|uniref:hypothetical protein n=1 Tax=Corynebacterium sp. LK31 TaxID=2044576 RepID=UPI001651FE99|nr:hypothetical protein [Corynebacterium sp. LK31]MBC6798049.1 hypothetical protein [Corynebacterium sp. LK31]
MLSSFYAIGGPGAALTVATLMVAIWGAKPLIARWPEQLGSLVSFAATWTLAMLFSGVMGPDLAMAGSHDLGAGFAIGAFLLTVLVWVAPAGNCHRGWSTFIGLIPINVGMFIAAAWPQHSGVTSLIAASLGCALIFLRLRHHAGQAMQNEDARKKRRIRTVAAGIIGGILLMSVAAVATPPKANAMFGIFDDKLCSMMSPETTQEPIGTGPESWFPPKNFAQIPAQQTQEGVPNPPPYLDTPLKMEGDLDKYTLFEVAGLRGLRFVNWTHTASGGYDCSFGAFMSVNSGNSINTLSRAILQAVIALKEYSQTKNPFAALYAQFSPMLDVFITIAMSAFGLLYMVSLIVLLFKLVKGGSLQTHGGKLMGGLLAAFLFGVVYNGSILTASMENPNGSLFYEVMSDADSFVGTLNAAVASEVLDGIPDAESSMCRKPEGGTNSVEDGQRYSSCLMAEVIAYRPWAKAQFGISGERQIEPNVKPVEGASNSKDGDPKALPCYNNYNGCSDIRSYLIAQAGGPSYIQDYEKCLSSNGYEIPGPDDDADPPEIDQLRVCDPYYAVAEDFFQKQRTDKTKAQGTEMLLSYTGRSGGHASSAFFGLVAAVVVGGIIAVIAAATLMAHFQLLWLFLTGPFYFLGAMLRGFEVVNKWGAQVIQTFILRMFYGFAVTGIILAISIIAVLDVSSGFRMLLLGLMVGSVIKGLRKLDAMTAFGGAEPAGFSSGGMKVGAAAAGVAGYKGGTAAARSAVRAAPRVGKGVAGAAGAAAGKVLPTKTIGKGVDFINSSEKAGKNMVASRAGSIAGAVVPGKGAAGVVSRAADTVKAKSSAVSEKVSEVANQKAPFKSSYAASRVAPSETKVERVDKSSGVSRDSGSTARRVASSQPNSNQGTQAGSASRTPVQRRRSRSADNFDDPTGTLGGGSSSQRDRRQNRRGHRDDASKFSTEDKANRMPGAKSRDSKPAGSAQGSRNADESRPQRPQRNEPRPAQDRLRQARRSAQRRTSGRPPFDGNDKSE